jgi:hypothetical protein
MLEGWQVWLLIDLFIADLLAGYRQVRNARQELMKKWRLEMLRAYSRKWERHAQRLAQQERRREQFQKALPFLGAALLLPVGLGAWFVLSGGEQTCLGMFLMLGTGFGVLMGLGGWMRLTTPPEPPENPVSHTKEEEDSPLRQQLFPDLVPLWRREMALIVPTEEEAQRMAEQTGRWGLIGEFDFIRQLERIVSENTYILQGLQPRTGDEMDVMVIGPKGLWYFEVSHWNAHFSWRNGVWEIWHYDPETGGYHRPADVRESPDAEWRRLRDEALANLRAATGDLLTKRPSLANIRGGIVFTNEHALVEIGRTAPFAYGNIDQWISTYRAAPRLKEMSQARVLQLLDVLLKRHQSFYPEAAVHSMKDSVTRVMEYAEEGIRAWMESE